MKKLDEIIAFRDVNKGACLSTTHANLSLGEVVDVCNYFKDKEVRATRPALDADDKEEERVWTVTIPM